MSKNISSRNWNTSFPCEYNELLLLIIIVKEKVGRPQPVRKMRTDNSIPNVIIDGTFKIKANQDRIEQNKLNANFTRTNKLSRLLYYKASSQFSS